MPKPPVHLPAYIFAAIGVTCLEQAASRTERFVRVYERPRSGFQFSPIISNGGASRQDLSGHYSFYHFLYPPLPRPRSLLFRPLVSAPSRLSFSLSLSSFSRHRFFGLQTAGAFSKPDVGELIKHTDFPGSPITSCRYYRRERGVP